jgi:hypothetical protein
LPLIQLSNNSELRSISTREFLLVTRLKYDEGAAVPLQFVASDLVCSLNSGEGDGVSEVRGADGKCWLAMFPPGGIDIRQHGCVLDGNYDCYPSIVGALALARKNGLSVLVPNGVARSSKAIIVGEVKIRGDGLISPTSPLPSGSQIRCDNTVKECLVAGWTGATGSGANVSIRVSAALMCGCCGSRLTTRSFKSLTLPCSFSISARVTLSMVSAQAPMVACMACII